MKKKRYLPFGYRMIGGKIEIISEESDLVQNIFRSYLAGASLQQLAKLAEQTGLQFRENANVWNKNMISRILDDKRYWQKGLFPAIIQEELALQVSELKSSKASPKPSLHFLQKKIICFQCGKPLSRNSRSLPQIYWDCKDCGTKIGPIADNELLDAIKEKFLSVCHDPQMTELERISNNFLSMKAVRLTNEINQMFDQREVDPDRLLPMILECAAEKYRASADLSYGRGILLTERRRSYAGYLPANRRQKHARRDLRTFGDVRRADVFTDLDKVQKGDLILLHVLGDTLAYAVDTITVTDPADIEAIEIRQDKDLVTLVTCTPYSVNTHRLLVRGHRIELTEEEITEETKATEPEASTWMEKYIEGIFFGFIIGGAVLVLVRALSKKVRENQ